MMALHGTRAACMAINVKKRGLSTSLISGDDRATWHKGGMYGYKRSRERTLKVSYFRR
jgi:hypothetical protein